MGMVFIILALKSSQNHKTSSGKSLVLASALESAANNNVQNARSAANAKLILHK